MRPLADAPALAKIVILDAARPLPFRIQGGRLARGLSAIESAPGMLVAFSAAPGEIAEDGPGPYGAYATAIAEMVREPGLDLDTMFARIRVRTHEATNGQQTPWEVSQLNQVVMLVPGAAVAPPGAPQALSRAADRGGRAAACGVPPRPMTGIGAEEAYAYAIEQDDLPTYVGIRPRPSEQSLRATHLGDGSGRGARRSRGGARCCSTRRKPTGPICSAIPTECMPMTPSGGCAVFPPACARRRGFRMLEFDDVPPPVAGEPARLFDVYPAAPPPPRRPRTAARLHRRPCRRRRAASTVAVSGIASSRPSR